MLKMKMLALFSAILMIVVGCGGKENKSEKTVQKTTVKPVSQAVKTINKEVKLDPNSRPIVVIETDYGNIEIELRPDKAPQTCANFAKLANKGFYDSLIFHRIVPGFVIQGGDPEGTGRGGPGYTVPAEITDLKHTTGAVACARLPDQVNPSQASSGSQFYITLKPTPFLDNQYTVFGYVKTGMDVVQKIAKVETDSHDKPLTPVIMKKVYVKKETPKENK